MLAFFPDILINMEYSNNLLYGQNITQHWLQVANKMFCKKKKKRKRKAELNPWGSGDFFKAQRCASCAEDTDLKSSNSSQRYNKTLLQTKPTSYISAKFRHPGSPKKCSNQDFSCSFILIICIYLRILKK